MESASPLFLRAKSFLFGKRVHFDSSNREYEIPNSSDFTKEEKSRMWYRSREIKQMRADRKELVLLIDAGKIVCGDEDFCCGLESKQDGRLRAKLARQSVLNVLIEQELQWELGDNDPERIADCYFKSSCASHIEAHVAAVQLEKSVRTYITGSRWVGIDQLGHNLARNQQQYRPSYSSSSTLHSSSSAASTSTSTSSTMSSHRPPSDLLRIPIRQDSQRNLTKDESSSLSTSSSWRQQPVRSGIPPPPLPPSSGSKRYTADKNSSPVLPRRSRDHSFSPQTEKSSLSLNQQEQETLDSYSMEQDDSSSRDQDDDSDSKTLKLSKWKSVYPEDEEAAGGASESSTCSDSTVATTASTCSTSSVSSSSTSTTCSSTTPSRSISKMSARDRLQKERRRLSPVRRTLSPVRNSLSPVRLSERSEHGVVAAQQRQLSRRRSPVRQQESEKSPRMIAAKSSVRKSRRRTRSRSGLRMSRDEAEELLVDPGANWRREAETFQFGSPTIPI